MTCITANSHCRHLHIALFHKMSDECALGDECPEMRHQISDKDLTEHCDNHFIPKDLPPHIVSMYFGTNDDLDTCDMFMINVYIEVYWIERNESSIAGDGRRFAIAERNLVACINERNRRAAVDHREHLEQKLITQTKRVIQLEAVVAELVEERDQRRRHAREMLNM